MGIMRKTLSISTMGLVNFRSAKERTARYARQTRNAARANAAAQAASLQVQRGIRTGVDHRNIAENAVAEPARNPPPGWYRDPSDWTIQSRWWNGLEWTKDYIDATGQRRQNP